MEQRPVVFVLPGMLGEDWRIAEFLAALSLSFDTILLKHEDGDGARGLKWVAQRTADRIMTHEHGGGPAILGYSYGANVAFEAVTILKARGCFVPFLCMIDPALPDTDFNVFDDIPARSVKRDYNRPGWLLFLLKRRLAWLALRAVPHRKTRSRLRNKMHVHGRLWARRGWKPQTLQIAGLLVLSSQLRGATETGLRKLCPMMDVRTIDTRHIEILSDASGQSVVRALLEFGNWHP